ncbi:MAG: lipopolysaccharide biosynthesis protein [Ignavibacteria bacterium]
MSLTDKVIKNTFYYFISQIVSLLIPMILTPYIISKIGLPAFGIYTIILGFISSFGLFDLSISTSFIKFLSEYYNKNDDENLNRVLNTGFFFYLVFFIRCRCCGFSVKRNAAFFD